MSATEKPLLTRRRVVASFRFEALHQWPEAGDVEPQVSFLQHLHRHEFHVRVEKVVNHGDREVEFILLKREAISVAESLTTPGPSGPVLGRMSCEDIAEQMISALGLDACEVFEDGENGARVEVER